MSDQYAVIGHPVEHSLSPEIHAEFARATGQDVTYTRILAPLDGFEATARTFFAGGGKGLNVTLPFKAAAWQLAETHAAPAREAGAVNTLKFENGRLNGYNTDGVGLTRDLRDNLGCAISGRRVLLMGAGGASYGVLGPLLRETPRQLAVANRTLEKAVDLVSCFQSLHKFAAMGVEALPYAALAGRHFDVVINATSAGLADSMPSLPNDLFAPGALAYDMVYGRTTPFMEFSGRCGARVAGGLGMLVEQAAESFFIWRGVRPATAPVIQALRMKAEG